MNTPKTNVDFKAVEFMRSRREDLGQLFLNDPQRFWDQLEAVRKKYKGKFHKKSKGAA